MKHYYYIAFWAFLVAGLPIGLSAQKAKKDTTMTRTVVVEQEYTPIISDASKINVLPRVEEPKLTQKEVEYATTISPAWHISGQLLKPYLITDKQPNALPGYVRVGYGNYGNLDFLGNYLFQLSSKDKLNARFAVTGFDGSLDQPTKSDAKWKAYHYRTQADFDYIHHNKTTDLTIGANWGVSNFNYHERELGKQKFSFGDVSVGLVSIDESAKIQYNVGSQLLLYGRQNSYFGGNDATETQLHTNGLVSATIRSDQRVKVAFDMRNLFYSTPASLGSDGKIFRNRTLLDLNPSYEQNNDNWRFHLGANVDLSFGAGNALRLSPDLKVDYLFNDNYVIYASATGGRDVADFRRLEQVSPYLLLKDRINDSYEALNTTLGIKMSPCDGLWFNFFGGFQALKDEWYQLANVDHYSITAPPFVEAVFYSLGLSEANVNNTYLGLRSSYDYKDLFSLTVEGTYRNWTSKSSDTPLLANPFYFKPEIEFTLQTAFHPITPLRVQAGFDHKRWATKLCPNINNLYLSGTYRLMKTISIYARLDNILNESYQSDFIYTTEGFNFIGGLNIQF